MRKSTRSKVRIWQEDSKEVNEQLQDKKRISIVTFTDAPKTNKQIIKYVKCYSDQVKNILDLTISYISLTFFHILIFLKSLCDLQLIGTFDIGSFTL